MDQMPHRVVNWLVLLAVFGMAAGLGGPPESRGHAAELATAESGVTQAGTASRSAALPRQTLERAAPQKVYDLLEALQRRNGDPLPGYVGGNTFRNRERRLPRGRYREYDVNRKIPGRPRDAERLVIEQQSGKAYYTNDHYRTFVPLNESP
jgi:ribonuclease T1